MTAAWNNNEHFPPNNPVAILIFHSLETTTPQTNAIEKQTSPQLKPKNLTKPYVGGIRSKFSPLLALFTNKHGVTNRTHTSPTRRKSSCLLPQTTVHIFLSISVMARFPFQRRFNFFPRCVYFNKILASCGLTPASPRWGRIVVVVDCCRTREQQHTHTASFVTQRWRMRSRLRRCYDAIR